MLPLLAVIDCIRRQSLDLIVHSSTEDFQLHCGTTVGPQARFDKKARPGIGELFAFFTSGPLVRTLIKGEFLINARR